MNHDANTSRIYPVVNVQQPTYQQHQLPHQSNMNHVQPINTSTTMIANPYAGQQPVITTQPQSQTVIINQAPLIIGKQAWRVGLCDCFHNMKHCLCTFFFSQCYSGCLASRMDESCCVGCYLGPAGLMAMRASIRAKHNLEGDICTDCCVTSCCYMCAVCQTANELDHQGYKN